MRSTVSQRQALIAAVATLFLIIGLIYAPSAPAAFTIGVITIATAAIHTMIAREGGPLSRVLYHYGISPGQTDVIIAALSATIIISWLMLTNLLYSAFLGMLFVPVIIAAMRGGLRLSFGIGASLFVALGLFFAFDPRGSEQEFAYGLSFLIVILIAALVVGALANRLRRAAMDLSALYETGKAISASLELEEILDMVTNIIYIDMAVDLCAIFMIDETTDTLKVEAGRGLVGDDAYKARVRIGEGVPGWVVKHSQPLRIAEIDPRQLAFLSFGIRSVIAAPLLVGGNPIGVLLVGKDKVDYFGQEEMEFLEALAGQTANAVRNAQVFKETEQFAIRDGLTGSYNYRYFAQHLADQAAEAVKNETALSLIMIDIDHFKKINDNYGHLVGDKVLKSLARLLERNTRETDLVARYGGEEFVIVLPGAKYEDAFRIAVKLRDSVERASFLARERESSSLKITVSLGVATYPTLAASEHDLVNQADQSLYAAKETRNTVCSPLECEESSVQISKEQDAGTKKRRSGRS